MLREYIFIVYLKKILQNGLSFHFKFFIQIPPFVINYCRN